MTISKLSNFNTNKSVQQLRKRLALGIWYQLERHGSSVANISGCLVNGDVINVVFFK